MFSTKKWSAGFPWKILTVEAVLVVLSVLLALGLNSWREARSHQELARRALQGVIDEVQINCPEVERIHPYHQEVANGVQEPGGVRTGLLRNDAWEAAQTTGAASYLDYEIVVAIGRIHAHQSDHRSMVQSYTQALFNIMLQNESIKNIHREGERLVIRELVYIQNSLLEEYQNLLVLAEEHYGDTVDISGSCGEEN